MPKTLAECYNTFVRDVIDKIKSDPRYDFEERVQRLMKKGNTRDEAEAVVLTVVATKEMPYE